MKTIVYPGFVSVVNCTDQTLTDVTVTHACGIAPPVSFTVAAIAPGTCATELFSSQVDVTDIWSIRLRSASGRVYTGRIIWEYTHCDSPQGVILQLALDQWFVVNPVAARGEASYVPTGPLEAAPKKKKGWFPPDFQDETTRFKPKRLVN